MMNRLRRLAVAVIGLSLVCAFMFVLTGKLQQRNAVLELLKQENIAVQFTDGEYCETIDVIRKRNWITDRVDVVYFDVQNGGTTKEFLLLIERLPSISRVIIRYQGSDLEEFWLPHKMILDKLAEESSVVAKGFPNLEVLNCWGVARENPRSRG